MVQRHTLSLLREERLQYRGFHRANHVMMMMMTHTTVREVLWKCQA